TRDGALVGLDGGDGAAVGAEAGDGHAGADGDALRLRLAGESAQGRVVVGVAAALLVQHHGDARCLPVGEHVQHVAAAVVDALDQLGRVADRLLLTVDLRDVLVHLLWCDLQVPDRVVGERLGVGLPDVHGVRHQLPHGGLEVVVAEHAAGHTRRARADVRLVDDQYVTAVATAGGLQPAGQVPGGRQTVNAGTDDDVAGT